VEEEEEEEEALLTDAEGAGATLLCLVAGASERFWSTLAVTT